MLPIVQFPSGSLFFNNKTCRETQTEPPVAIHTNWINGAEKMVFRLQSLGSGTLGTSTAGRR